MIEQILITNLARRPDRRSDILEWLSDRGYSVDCAQCFAHDMLDYSDEEAIRVHAVQDGFHFFKDLEQIHVVFGGSKWQKCALAWLWTWVSMLRKIVLSRKLTLLLIDDRPPMVDSTFMHSILSEVYDGAFKGLQLDIDTCLIESRELAFDVQSVSHHCGRGFIAHNDCGFILSPQGADYLLDCHNKTPELPPYEIVWGCAEPGCYHALDSVCGANRNDDPDWEDWV